MVNRGYLLKELCFVFGTVMLRMAVTVQGNSGKNEFLQGLEKVWEFYSQSEKIYIFERNQGKSVADLGKGPGRESQGISQAFICENYYGRGCSGIKSYTAAPFLSVYLLEHVKKPIIN